MSLALDTHKAKFKGPHEARGKVVFLRGSLIYEGTITDTGSNPYITLTLTADSGSLDANAYDLPVYIYSSTGKYKGVTKVSRASIPTSTAFSIQETPSGLIGLTAGDTVEVYDAPQIMPKIPTADKDFKPDGEAYSNQNSLLKPVVCSGGPYIGTLVGAATTYAFDFDGADSFATDPDSAGSLTHFWEFPAGSTPGTSTSATPSGVTIPAGIHHIKHTVTDVSNSQSELQYVPVVVVGSNTPTYEARAVGVITDRADGWKLNITLMDDLPVSEVPDGIGVLFYVDEPIEQSYGAYQQAGAHIKFFGWLVRDSQTVDSTDNVLSFQAASTKSRLNTITGYSQVFTNTATPTSWQEFKDLSVGLAIIQLLRTYTTALKIVDFSLGITDVSYPQLFVQQQTPGAQVADLCNSIDAEFSCDRRGALFVYPFLGYTAIADRASITKLITLDTDDIISLEINRDPSEKVSIVESRGITGGGAGFFSRWPGNAPNRGVLSTVVDRLIVSEQSELNIRAGYRGAYIEGIYVTSGQRIISPDVTITLEGYYDFFDLYNYYVSLSLADIELRDSEITTLKYIIQSADSAYENGSVRTTVRLKGETHGLPGATYIPPSNPGTGNDDDLPPLPPNSPGAPDLSQFYGVNKIVAILANGSFSITNNFRDGATTSWANTDISGTVGGTIRAMAVDPTSPLYQGTGTAVNVYITATNGVFRINDIFGLYSIDTLYSGTIGSSSIDVDYTNNPGQYIQVVFVDTSDSDIYIMSSSNGGTSFSSPVLLTDEAGTGRIGLSIDPHRAGQAWVCPGTNDLYKLTGSGSSAAIKFSGGPADWQEGGAIMSLANSRFLWYASDGEIARFDVVSETMDLMDNTVAPPAGLPLDRGCRFTYAPDPGNAELCYLFAPKSDLSTGYLYKVTGFSTGSPMTFTILHDMGDTNWYFLAIVGNLLYVWGAGARIGYFNLSTGVLTLCTNIGAGLPGASIVGIAGGD